MGMLLLETDLGLLLEDGYELMLEDMSDDDASAAAVFIEQTAARVEIAGRLAEPALGEVALTATAAEVTFGVVAAEVALAGDAATVLIEGNNT